MTKKRRTTQTKPLTRRQAWLVVATAFEARSGICLMLHRLRNLRLISAELHNKMDNELRTKRPPNAEGYWWPLNDNGNGVRADLALTLAKAVKR